MLKRMEVYIIALLLILVTTIIMVVFTMDREQEYRAHTTNIQRAIVDDAVYAINIRLDEKRHHVKLFIDEYSHLFQHLELYPGDEVNRENIRRRLEQRFSSFFTFTIADNEGNPELMDIDTLVGEACQADLESFASRLDRGQQHTNEIFVHPQPFNYHYDVMVPLTSQVDGSKIFFVSFYLDEMADILKTHEIPGQQLFIVRQSNPGLIEVSRVGARDQLSRNPELTPGEQNRILVFANIPGTDWRLVNLPDENFEKEYIEGLWWEVIVILVIMTFGFFLMISIAFNICARSREDENNKP